MSDDNTSKKGIVEKFFEDQRCLHDIIKGVSECSHSLVKEGDTTPPFFLKHPTMLDTGMVAVKNKEYEEMARKKGLKTEIELVQILIDTNNWCPESEKKYKNLNIQIKNLSKTKSQIFLESQRNIIKKKLEDAEEEFKKIEHEREPLLGLTVEQFVTNRTNIYSLWHGMYKDKNTSTRLYESFEDFYELHLEDVDLYQMIYTLRMGFFTIPRLKRVAVDPTFMNSYMLADGKPLEFFGRIAVDLTTYQLSLLNLAGNFSNILENAEGSMPDDIDDGDDVVKWLENERDRLQAKYNQDGGSSKPRTSENSEFQAYSTPTATSAERESLSHIKDAPEVDLKTAAEELKKELGKDKLDTMDLAKLHGLM